MRNMTIFALFIMLFAVLLCTGCEGTISAVQSDTTVPVVKNEPEGSEAQIAEEKAKKEELQAPEISDKEEPTEPESVAAEGHTFGYIDNNKPDEYDAIVKELENSMEMGMIEDFIVECIVDDFDQDGELEAIAVTTPEYNRNYVETGDYDSLYPATLWGYEKYDGEYMWLSDPFFEDNADGLVKIYEANIKPGVVVLQADFFKSAHDVRSEFYTFGDIDYTKNIGTFDNGMVNKDGIILSDHDAYEYDLENGTFQSVDATNY